MMIEKNPTPVSILGGLDDIRLERKLESYAACSPEAISKGSEAQMLFFVRDAQKDIAALAEALMRVTRNREMWKGQVERQSAELSRLRSERSYVVGCNEGFETAIEQAANLIEENMICGPEGSQVLRSRENTGNKIGMAYVAAIRALAAKMEGE